MTNMIDKSEYYLRFDRDEIKDLLDIVGYQVEMYEIESLSGHEKEIKADLKRFQLLHYKILKAATTQ